LKIKELLNTQDKEKERCRKEVEGIKRDIESLENAIETYKEKLAERKNIYHKYLEMDVNEWINKYPDKRKRI